MHFKFYIYLFLLIGIQGFSQITEVSNELKRIKFKRVDSLQGWNTEGNIKLNLNQAQYNNWQAGEDNRIELSSNLRYNFTYQKDKIIWDNVLFSNYGVNKLKGYDIRKTTDKIEINSIVGGQLPKNWSYSLFLNLQTQLTNTYNYDEDEEKQHRIAGFLAPLYVTAGPGVMWRKSKNLHFNIAPVTTKVIYINGKVSKYNSALNRFERSDETTLFGIEPGEHMLYKFGFYASAFYKFELMKNVFVDNRFSFYSNYLDNAQNIDMDYMLNVTMKVNKFISSNLQVQARYDNNEHPGFQLRETLGIGLNFNL